MLERKWRNIWCALKAIATTWREEPSFRVQMVVILLLYALAAYFRITLIEWMLLSLAFAAVVSTELINTALERIGNVFARTNDPEIGLIKDLGTAAVCAIQVGALLLIGIIFVPHLIALL